MKIPANKKSVQKNEARNEPRREREKKGKGTTTKEKREEGL